MQIVQLATALPKKAYSNEELVEAFPCSLPEGVKQNVANLGVSTRYLLDQKPRAETETTLSEDGLVDLCAKACHKALKEASLSIMNIDYLIVAYDASPFLSPGLSQILAPRLELNSHIGHVNAQGGASTAFPKTLELAQNRLALHPKDHILICISGVNSCWFQNQVRSIKDVMEVGQISKIKNEDKRLMELRKWVATIEFFLFGDGAASAIVANRGEGLAVKEIVEVTNLRKKDYLAGYARLTSGNEPFKFGFYSHLDKEIPRLGSKYTSMVLKELLRKNPDATKTAKKWVVHTGSEKILNLLAETHRIGREKLRESHEVLNEYGNLGAASLPFILERTESENRLSRGDTVLMVGYGWGFSAAACLLEKT
jgi:3-oxoacyl-[acyl-carrier-protein] synthase III